MTQLANPFGTEKHSSPVPQSSSLVEIESQRAIAETQVAMIIARKFPRNMILVMDRIMAACTRPILAEKAMYAYSRGGTEITGPSIHLAKVLAQEFGNIQFGIRELDQVFGESTVESYCWDVERNVRENKIFKVKHVRNTKKGSYALEDGNDIYELVANNGARRLRACILGIIPGDVVETAVKQCEETLHTKIQITPEILKRMIEKFSEYGVSKEQIEKRIQRRIEAITPALMVQLGKISNSLKDGMSTPIDWFEPVQMPEGDPQTGVAGLKEKIKKSSPKEETKKESVVSSNNAIPPPDLQTTGYAVPTPVAKDEERPPLPQDKILQYEVRPSLAGAEALSPEDLSFLKIEWGKATRDLPRESVVNAAIILKDAFGFTRFEDVRTDQVTAVHAAILDLKLKKGPLPSSPSAVPNKEGGN